MAVYKEALRASPLHMHIRSDTIGFARKMGLQGAAHAQRLLTDGADALEVQLNAFYLNASDVAHCLAMLAWQAAAAPNMKGGPATTAGATDTLLKAVARVTMRALELEPGERLAQATLVLIRRARENAALHDEI